MRTAGFLGDELPTAHTHTHAVGQYTFARNDQHDMKLYMVYIRTSII